MYDEDRVRARAGVERRLASAGADLARHILRVAARNRSEDRAAADPVRGARRTGAGATRALLLPRLLVTAGDVLANLRRGVALTLVGEIRLHRLVHHRHVHGAVEQRLGQRGGIARRALRRVGGCLECGIGISHVMYPLTLLPHDDDAAGLAGDRAADVDQIALGIDLFDAEMRLGVPCIAVVTGHLLALDDARWIRAGSDGAGTAVLRVAVRVRTAADTVALHDALKAAALRGASDLHRITDAEDVDFHDVADVVRRNRR